MSKQAMQLINEHMKKDILNMLDAIKMIVSTEMDADDVKTVEIYVDTITALVSEDPNAFPEEKKK